ncbi:unnamed protein product [Trifolium pratense]|uniref:Uncharacterized protein n=1 Tax=Trifolium pratense TaxID=57577 RepID=A0ACB0LHV2_TRIPR|nr:unnamed protein product [Trifolium pratense]
MAPELVNSDDGKNRDSAAGKKHEDDVSNVKETKITPNPAYHLSSSDNPGTPLADSMVMAWIINSTDPSLHGSISHASTTKDVWLDLEERFAQTNAPRIHQLWRTLCLMQKQSDVTVTEFYTQFKSILDELDELQPLPECSCGTSKLLIQREEDRRVHLFLGGFDNEEYAHVKATILNSEPMPSLRRVFNHIQREESRLAAEKEREVKVESGAAFHSSKGHKLKDKCDHCGKMGHIKARCFEIYGYPANWETRRTRAQYARGKQGEQSIAHMARAEEGIRKENAEASSRGLALHGMYKEASNMAVQNELRSNIVPQQDDEEETILQDHRKEIERTLTHDATDDGIEESGGEEVQSEG